MNVPRCYLCLVTLLCWTNSIAQSLRVVEVSDGSVVRVSATEPNLVEARHGRVSSFVFSEGVFTETIDAAAGVVYFRPLQEGPHSGFVEVVGTQGQRQRYSLVLVPDADWPAQRIVLLASPAPQQVNEQIVHVAQTAPHVASVKALLRKMLAPANSLGQRDEQEKLLVLGDLLLTRKATYPSGGLLGELYRLENRSSEFSHLDEASLHFSDDILAVAVATQTLAPKSATEVYFVRTKIAARNE